MPSPLRTLACFEVVSFEGAPLVEVVSFEDARLFEVVSFENAPLVDVESVVQTFFKIPLNRWLRAVYGTLSFRGTYFKYTWSTSPRIPIYFTMRCFTLLLYFASLLCFASLRCFIVLRFFTIR